MLEGRTRRKVSISLEIPLVTLHETNLAIQKDQKWVENKLSLPYKNIK